MKTISKWIIALLLVGTITMTVGFVLNGYQFLGVFDGYYSKEKVDIFDLDELITDGREITALDIDLEVSQIEIREHKDSKIIVETKYNGSGVEISQYSNTLKIKEDNKGWFWFNIMGNKKNKITIYIPQGKTFNNVDIDVDAGKIDIASIEATSINVHVDAGSLKAKKMICQSGDFDVNAGSISIDLLDSQQSTFDADAGSIQVHAVGKFEEYRYSARLSVGSIVIGDYKSSGIDKKETGGSGSRFIEADCDAGSITITMEE